MQYIYLVFDLQGFRNGFKHYVITCPDIHVEAYSKRVNGRKGKGGKRRGKKCFEKLGRSR